MNTKDTKTTLAKPLEIERRWVIIDATNQPAGRLAVEAAKLLRGKHRPDFTPSVDTGDHVIIVNAARVRLTGNKAEEPIHWHTGWPGGLRSVSRGKLHATKPERALERMIKGMLPHNTLGRQMAQKLKVYAGPDHPHEAQKPEKIEVFTRKGMGTGAAG